MFSKIVALYHNTVVRRFVRGFVAVVAGAGLSYLASFAGADPGAPAFMQSAVFAAAVLAADKWVRVHFGME